VDLPFYREYDLPWTADSSQERKFQRLLGVIFLAAIALGLVWPFIPTPEPDPYEIEEIPPRIAQLLLEEKPLPPPPPPVVEEEPEPEPEPEPDEPEPDEPEPEPEKVVETEPEPEPEPEIIPEPEPDLAEVAREQAQAAFMPFAEDLADLVDKDLLHAVDDRVLTASVGESERNERSMITSKVGAASGGINTASLSRNTGGSGIAARSTTQVASPVAGLGDAGGAQRTGTSGKASRSREEIELIFDKNKGAIFSLYNRALRQDPSLEGKIVLRLTIAPNGAVTFCEVVSSELGDPDLEQKLVARVLLFRFEAKDVEAITTTKPIDFFPA
jgi:TonB family protein